MKTIKAFLYTACFIAIMAGAWNIFNMNRSTAHATELYNALSEAKPSAAPEIQDDVSAGYNPVINPWLEELQAQNEELAAWITVDGTNINYPVMQTREDNDFYLLHDFYGEYDDHGTPFLDVCCSLSESDNLVIYGHHMQDKTMFQNLVKFREAEFCEENGGMYLDTPEESRRYQLAFVIVISAVEAKDFPYFHITDFPQESDYRDFIEKCEKYAVWHSGTLPEFGTRLLTLSTCEYTKLDGRLVVIAQEVGVEKR